MKLDRIVIAGFGAAGLAAATELRAQGWTGRLTVLSSERGLPYDRPPLSKSALTAPEPHPVELVSADGFARLELDWHEGVRAAGLDVAARTVLDDTGTEHGYDALVIATGVRPRPLPGDPRAGGPPASGDHLHVLRTLADARALRHSLREGRSLVIVGGGFLGFEVAASARSLGVETTVVEPLTHPLADRLGPQLARRVVQLHRQHGVRVLTGRGVRELHPTPAGAATLTLDDGTVLRPDTVLVSIGAQPNIEWLQGSGLDLDGGVGCDAQLRAAPGIWAAGDLARWFDIGLGRSVRIEHRTNATEQGRAVARGILGDPAPFTPTPWIWTDQYDARVQIAGWTPPELTPTVAVGDPDADSFVLEWRDQRLHGVAGWNSARAMMPLRRELMAQVPAARPEVRR